MRWTDAYEEIGRQIVVPVKLIHAIGAKGAILMAQLFHWLGKQQSEDGWIYKTQIELEEETGLSRHEQNTCVEILKKKQVLETRYDRLEHRLYYRISKDALDAIMEGNTPGEIRKADIGKADNRTSGSAQSGFREQRKADFAYIEQEKTTREDSKEEEARKRASYAASNGISGEDARALFGQWETGEWHDGAGNRICNWKQKLLTFRDSGYLPSQKRARNGHETMNNKRRNNDEMSNDQLKQKLLKIG